MPSLQNKTALVTGASSGIGEAIARQLASQGCKLILVARSETALQQLAAQLRGAHAVQIEVLAADLAQPDCGPAIQQQIETRGLQVDILINNAGIGTYGPFETLSPQSEQELIAVNIAAVVSLSHAVIPGMLSRASGAILNLASISAYQACAYMAVYAASKAFVLSFSEALWAEYRDRGIHVAALCPGPVETAFIAKLHNEDIRKTSVFAHIMRPEQVADEAIKALKGTAPSRIIGIKNWLMANSTRLAPRSLVAKAGAKMLRPPEQPR
jgi:short-subunit dehydrogenase